MMKPVPPFLTKDLLKSKHKLNVVVDVTCDITNPDNPLPIYKQNSTFDDPTGTLPVDPSVSVIGIDHLPTMVPRESSEQFSRDLLPSLFLLPDRENSRVWVEAENLFRTRLSGK